MNELSRAFAALPEVVDGGFSEAVIARLAARERRIRVVRGLAGAGLVVAAAAVSIAGGALVRELSPFAVAALGLAASAGAWIVRPAARG